MSNTGRILTEKCSQYFNIYRLGDRVRGILIIDAARWCDTWAFEHPQELQVILSPPGNEDIAIRLNRTALDSFVHNLIYDFSPNSISNSSYYISKRALSFVFNPFISPLHSVSVTSIRSMKGKTRPRKLGFPPPFDLMWTVFPHRCSLEMDRTDYLRHTTYSLVLFLLWVSLQTDGE